MKINPIIQPIFLCLALLSFNGVTAQKEPSDPNLSTVRAAYEAINQRNWAGFAALCDKDFVDINAGPEPVKGIQNVIGLYQQYFAGFPDMKILITDIAPAGSNKYLLRVQISATHTGTFMGIPPTGKSLKWTDADIVVLNGAGKCISHEVTRTGEAMAQIGQASMLNPSTQTVMAVYQKFGQADIAGLLAMCAENVVFDIHDRLFDAQARVFKGGSEVGSFFGELAGKVKYSKFQPTRFVADGDDVFIVVETEYEHLPTKKMYASTYTHQFKVVNGKVVYFKGMDGFARPR